GEPDVVPAGGDHGRDGLEVGRAAAGVDVDPVRLGTVDVDARAEPRQHLRRADHGGAVGAVDGDAQARQVRREAGRQALDVALPPLGPAVDRPYGAGLGPG